MNQSIIPLARFGYLSYGIVYLAMGALAIRAAAGLAAYGIFALSMARYRRIIQA